MKALGIALWEPWSTGVNNFPTCYQQYPVLSEGEDAPATTTRNIPQFGVDAIADITSDKWVMLAIGVPHAMHTVKKLHNLLKLLPKDMTLEGVKDLVNADMVPDSIPVTVPLAPLGLAWIYEPEYNPPTIIDESSASAPDKPKVCILGFVFSLSNLILE